MGTETADPPWWYVVVAALLLGAGGCFYWMLNAWEAEGGSRRLHWLIYLLYEAFGKRGVAAWFVAFAAVALCLGWAERKRRNSNEDNGNAS